jgi:diaminopimelate epimerase
MVSWLKGHGTLNDFILLPDLDGTVFGDLDAGLVRRLCDRHRGIGADGVLRVVQTKAALHLLPALPEGVDETEWFMDYRNADGSVAEMCGNGIRVYVRYLVTSGLVTDTTVPIGTRSGVRVVTMAPDGQFTVSMGSARVPPESDVFVSTQSGPERAMAVFCPNPHAVAFVNNLRDVGPLTEAPRVAPGHAFPDGVNVDFVTRRGPQHVAMRVFERGVGETLSCGTGACAAAIAAMRLDAAPPATPYVVDVRGGRLTVTEQADGDVRLTGPAEITLQGTVDLSE